MNKKNSTVVLGVTGSIAVYKACDITTGLVRAGFDVRVILTDEACEFIKPITFQTLSRNKVITSMFDAPEEWDPAHISLAERADLILIAPATANIIGKLASGICDDMLSCTVLASRSQVVIAPAMNVNMYKHPLVQQNIVKLKKIGYKFIGPVNGPLACGYEGMGHIASVDDIVREAKTLLKRNI